MTKTFSKRWLNILEQLADGLLIITASNRQADFLRQQYRYYQSNNANQISKVWQRPAIITDKQWLMSLHAQLMIHHSTEDKPWLLLSDQESRLLWEQIIENDGDYLLDTRRTAERVRQAANRIEQWLLTDAIVEDDSFNWRKETRRFRHWHQAVQQKCQSNNWLEYSQLDRWVSQRISLFSENNNTSLLPKNIALLGFQQLSPAREQLFDCLTSSGICLLFLAPDEVNTDRYRLELADSKEEIKQAAVWAKQLWLSDPSQRIGIVVPDLNHNRELTRLTFERLFCPAEMFTNDDQTHRPFDISLGVPLSSYPLIDTALTIVTLISDAVSQDEIIQLLQSPYLCSATEQNYSIELSYLLRKSKQVKFNITDLLYFSSLVEKQQPGIEQQLQLLAEFKTSGKSMPSQWALKLADILEQIHWSAKRPLSSTEYQTKEAWNKKIEQMAVFDNLSTNISWGKFRSLFTRLTHETLFQPQTGDCPIQIMGVLEAAFLTFDQIRVCGVDNRLWPETAKPSPFIPYELQRLHNMPNATAERELSVSKQLLQLLSKAAETVIFSHSRGNGEESLSVSPLLEDVQLRAVQDYDQHLFPAQLIHQKGKKIEYLEDDSAPKPEAALVRGGSKLLQDIARCQFRAFAHHRLFAVAAEQPTEGLDALDRGNLVHQILENCWLHLFNKQQSTLQALHQSNRLSAELEPFIDRAIDSLQNHRHNTFSDALVNIERQRLRKLLLQWFDIEIARPAFTVAGVEQSLEAIINHSHIHLQLDRIDQLEDGSLAIIDYKTGKVQRKNWFGERPDEPQLPLYAVVLADQHQTIGALLYGQVKNAECRYLGVADDHLVISGVSKDFKDDPLNADSGSLVEQINKWRTDLTNLMQEYLSGDSAVTPRDEQVCRYCDLHGLCRINEMSQRLLEQAP